jgi:hypothetical protein
MLAPFGAGQVELGVNDDLTASAAAPDIVPKKFDFLPALRAADIEDVPFFPVSRVLTRTLRVGHGVSSLPPG